jgi:tRNA pseudouridine38-40 synthase
MQAAAKAVEGEHDFTSFAASDPDAAARADPAAAASAEGAAGPTGVRRIHSSVWAEEPGSLLVYRVRGSGFLHHMVRNLVGTFLDVGRGHIHPEQVIAILHARDRQAAGPTAPARGLFLASVDY